MKEFFSNINNRIKRNKSSFIVYTILRILVILVAIRSIMVGDYESFLTCILSLILFLLPAIFEKVFHAEVPPLFQSIIYCFIFAAEILGEINRFYVKIPGWDTMLHTINGFLFAAVGFALVDLFNRSRKGIKLSPIYLAIVAFCFSMTIGVLWEFFEFAMDQFFGTDMQKDWIVSSFASNMLDSTGETRITVKDITETIIYTANGDYTISEGYLDIGIIDSMKDLLVNFVGAVVFSIIGYIYVKGKDKGKENLAGKLILKTLTDEEYAAQEEELRQKGEEAAEKRKKLKNKIIRKKDEQEETQEE